MRALLAAVLTLPLAAGPITFRDVTKSAGVRFKFKTDLMRGRLLSTMGGGVAMGDYDGDGWLDLFFTGSVENGKKPQRGPCGALFRNRGDGTFQDVTKAAGVVSCGWAMGASFVDVDSDGRLDLVVTGVGATSLYRNRGDGTFSEEPLPASRFAIGLAAGDVNRDGRVDLYVVNYLETTYEKEHGFPQFQVRIPEDYEGQEAYLFVQGKDGRFTERAAAAGVTNHGGKGIGGLFFDYDGDGIADLYVSNDRAPNVLYHGRGDGTFEDVTAQTGAGQREMKGARAGMGIALGDPDLDGHPDVLVTNFANEPNTFYRNVEGQLFDDGTDAANLSAAAFPYVQWGTDFADFDDDGWPDLVASSGHLVPHILLTLAKIFRKGGLGSYGDGNRSYKQPVLLWRNQGSGRFEEVSASAGDLGKLRLCSRGLAAGDVDGDGRVDVALAAISGGVRLLRNATEGGGRAIEILPVAGADHRTMLGTKVTVTSGERRQTQEFVLRPSYASGSWVPLHFGVGAATSVKVEATAPGATSPTVLGDVDTGHLYELREGKLRRLR